MRNVNASLKNGIDERGYGGALTQYDKATKQNHHNNDWQKPEFLSDTKKSPKFRKKTHLNNLKIDDALSQVLAHQHRVRSSSLGHLGQIGDSEGLCLAIA